MNRIKYLAGFVLGAIIALGVSSSVADDAVELDRDSIRQALKRGEALPLVRILAIAQQAVPGEVIEVELERDDGKLIYEIKVLTTKGRVREIEIDARTGSVLAIEDD
ncbi:PepSY domain-containing protein [Povalibacter sp.]|uniref:PepSY domain-containing protein n=1 Tax=Povalibacter sp. TaxID=1962978 RepID=UPI002F4082AA